MQEGNKMKKVTIIFLISMISSVSKGQVNSFDGFNRIRWNTWLHETDEGQFRIEDCEDFHRMSAYWPKISEYYSIFEKASFCNISTNEDFSYVADYKVEWLDYDYICEKEKRNNYCRFYAGSYTLEKLSNEEADNAFEVLSNMIEERYDIDRIERISLRDQVTKVFFIKEDYMTEDPMIELNISDAYNDEENSKDIIIKYTNHYAIINFEEEYEIYERAVLRTNLPL